MIYHGGNLVAAKAQFGDPVEGWLDLSTGISPYPYPIPSFPGETWQRLPDQNALKDLLEAARSYHQLPSATGLVAAPGTQILIQLLPLLFDARKHTVAVLSPTYEEHAASWRRAGFSVSTPSNFSDLFRAGIAIITRPNNPDGTIIARDGVIALARHLRDKEGMLIVDEAFADTIPEDTLSPLAAEESFISLRSFGKFFGLAGVRLGFAIGPASWADPLSDVLGPWAVPSPAIEIGRQALRDHAWIEVARKRLRDDRIILNDLLDLNGFTLLGGTDLFTLAAHESGAEIFTDLARQGIWVRRFPSTPQWLRFGLTSAPGLARLSRAITGLKRHRL